MLCVRRLPLLLVAALTMTFNAAAQDDACAPADSPATFNAEIDEIERDEGGWRIGLADNACEYDAVYVDKGIAPERHEDNNFQCAVGQSVTVIGHTGPEGDEGSVFVDAADHRVTCQ